MRPDDQKDPNMSTSLRRDKLPGRAPNATTPPECIGVCANALFRAVARQIRSREVSRPRPLEAVSWVSASRRRIEDDRADCDSFTPRKIHVPSPLSSPIRECSMIWRRALHAKVTRTQCTAIRRSSSPSTANCLILEGRNCFHQLINFAHCWIPRGIFSAKYRAQSRMVIASVRA